MRHSYWNVRGKQADKEINPGGYATSPRVAYQGRLYRWASSAATVR